MTSEKVLIGLDLVSKNDTIVCGIYHEKCGTTTSFGE
jgi:hypothetical protein